VCVKTSTAGACGKTSRNMPWLEATVRAYVDEMIRLELATVEPVDDAPPVDVSADVAALEGRIIEVREAASKGLMSMIDAGEILIAIRADIDALRAAQTQAVIDERHKSISREDALALWADTSLDTLGERRGILARYVKQVMVHPLPRGKWNRNNLPVDSITILPA
jgi:hypothetical protein